MIETGTPHSNCLRITIRRPRPSREKLFYHARLFESSFSDEYICQFSQSSENGATYYDASTSRRENLEDWFAGVVAVAVPDNYIDNTLLELDNYFEELSFD